MQRVESHIVSMTKDSVPCNMLGQPGVWQKEGGVPAPRPGGGEREGLEPLCYESGQPWLTQKIDHYSHCAIHTCSCFGGKQ